MKLTIEEFINIICESHDLENRLSFVSDIIDKVKETSIVSDTRTAMFQVLVSKVLPRLDPDKLRDPVFMSALLQNFQVTPDFVIDLV